MIAPLMGAHRSSPQHAAEQVRELVSGLPSARARASWMLILQAFVDASGKGDSNVLVIAGYVARADEWAKFSETWKEKLYLPPSSFLNGLLTVAYKPTLRYLSGISSQGRPKNRSAFSRSVQTPSDTTELSRARR